MRTFKKFTAVVLAVMLTLTMCVTGASAATASDGTNVVYLKPNTNWKSQSARFAVYMWAGSTTKWVSMTDEDADGYYEATLPEGDWTNIIFCRMNPATTSNNWNNKWNQSSDLTIPDDMNCYTVKSGTWDKGGGDWSLYTPVVTEPSTDETSDTSDTSATESTTVTEVTEAPTTEPVPVYDYTVAGDTGLTGVSWDPTTNGMTDEDADGVYEITFSTVAAGSYSFKVTDGSWANSWGAADGGNYSITLNSAADVKVTFDSATKEINVISDGLGKFELSYMAVVGNGAEGNGWMNGELWNTDTELNKMTDMGNGLWSITFTDVAAGTEYLAKFIANNSYTYNWTSDGNFDGQINPTITVAADNSTVTLTIDVSDYDFATKTGSVSTNVEVSSPSEPTESTDPTAPTEPTEVTEPTVTEPVEVDYYLFGYINGANYGCEEDFKNVGDYKFVDGTLTATFTEDSYVAVKTGDNSNWYMTDNWAGEVTSVILYNASVLDETANKLMVPAGEVTFTLVANENDTLTLSYTVKEVPTTTVEPTTTVQPTIPPTTAPVDVPTDGYYVMADSFKLKLAAAGSDKMVGTIALQAGTYKFKLDNFGTMLGYNKVITDTSNGLSFKATYSSSVTLNATGGTYTFQVSKTTNTLVVKYNATLPNEYLTGDLNTILSPVAGRTLAIGSVYLEAGTYKFKLSIGNVAFGYNKIVNDTTNGSSLSFKSTYGSSVTLNATGGTYTFTLNTATNRLTIGYVAAKDEALDDVHVSGDVNVVLDDNNGANNEAVGTVTLEEGTYSFQIYNYGVAYTAGVKINDAGTKQLSSAYKSNVTLIAAGGDYTFSFNKTTGKLVVEKA